MKLFSLYKLIVSNNFFFLLLAIWFVAANTAYSQRALTITKTPPTPSNFITTVTGYAGNVYGFHLPSTVKNLIGDGFSVDMTFNTNGLNNTTKYFLFGVVMHTSASTYNNVLMVYIQNQQLIVERRVNTPTGDKTFSIPSWNNQLFNYGVSSVRLNFWIDAYAMKMYLFEGTTDLTQNDVKRACEFQFYGMTDSRIKSFLTTSSNGMPSIIVPRDASYFTQATITTAREIAASPFIADAIQGLESPYFYPATFVHVADYGCGFKGTLTGTPYAKGVADLVKSWNPPVVVSSGDDNYGDPTVGHAGWGERCGYNIDDNVGQFYADFIRPYNNTIMTGGGTVSYTSQIDAGVTDDRFYPTPGNHDYASGIDKWKTYFGNPWASGQYWYSFVQDGIRYFMINSNTEETNITNFTSTSTQAQWLKTQLQTSHNNPAEKFQVVVMHHAPYTSVPKTDNHNQTLRWPFKDWGVDLVLSGDDHLYERNVPNSGVNNGLTFVTNGMGGHPSAKHVTSATQTAVTGFTILKHYEACPDSYAGADGDGCTPLASRYGALKIVKEKDYLYGMFRNADRELIDTFKVGRNPYVGSSFTDDAPTLLKINSAGDNISVYPNPTTGELTLRLQEPMEYNATIRVFDLAGKQVYTQSLILNKGTQEIALGNLKKKGISEGVYLLQIVSSKHNSTVKVVIQ